MTPGSFRRALRDPVRAGRGVLRRLGLVREVPVAERQLAELSRHARRLGVRGLNIIMSFDCDTPEDAASAADIRRAFEQRGIPMILAVPGAMLDQASAAYADLASRGAIFLNHGGAAHAEFRDGRYHARTFYNEWAPQAVEADIREGHRIVAAVTGKSPTGFRAPHFGYYQQPEQRELVYRMAQALGYRYCSDTLPAQGLARGPVYDVGPIAEFPLSGSIEDPTTILDSWNLLDDFVQFRLSPRYFELMDRTLALFQERSWPVLLNYYVDPAHVASTPHFMAAIDAARGRGARFVSFDDVLAGRA